MRKPSLGPVWGVLVAAICALGASAERIPWPIPCDGEVDLREEREPQGVRLVVENRCHSPVTVSLDLERPENVRPSRDLPFREELAAGARASLLRLAPRNAELGWGYRVLFGYRVGRADIAPDPAARYAMPFGGELARTLVQGVGGPTSHRGRYRHAFDFAMPLGTPVLAARAGRVVRVVDAFGPGGAERELMDRGNLVTVLHADGSFADYGHLSRGVVVRPGQTVETGELLGRSGDSGYTTGPHLHFHIWIPREEGDPTTIPIRFGPAGSEGFVPIPDRSYGPGPGRW